MSYDDPTPDEILSTPTGPHLPFPESSGGRIERYVARHRLTDIPGCARLCRHMDHEVIGAFAWDHVTDDAKFVAEYTAEWEAHDPAMWAAHLD